MSGRQHILITGLNNLNDPVAERLAKSWAERWVQRNYKAYIDNGKVMFEKYIATEFGGHGGGGEYKIQKGFGWTNGVIFDLLAKYGESLKL